MEKTEQHFDKEIWQELIKVVPFPAFVKNARMEYVYCNYRFAREIYNREPEELIGQTIQVLSDNLTQEQITSYYKRDEKILREGGHEISDTQIVCSDGKLHYFQESKILFQNKNTNEKFILAILTDITEKVKLQKELAEEHDFLTTLLKYSADNIYFKDLQSRFLKVSNILAEAHNLTPEKMIGKTDFDVWGPEHAAQAYNDEQEIIRSGKAIIGKEEKEDWSDGRITWVSSSKMPLYYNNSQIVGTFGISRDITELKLAEEEKNNNLIFEKMVSKISTIFIRHGSAYFNSALRIVLQELSEFVKCTRSYVYYMNEKDLILEKEEEYPTKTGLHPDYHHIKNFISWNKRLERSEIIFDLLTDLKTGSDLDELEYLKNNNLSHIIIIPIMNYSEFVGFVAFECSDLSMIWLKKYEGLFKILGEIFSNSFSNYNAEKYRLEAEEEMLKLLRAVNQSTNIIIIMDKDGYIEYVNSRFSELSEYSFDEVTGLMPHFMDPELNKQSDLTLLWQKIEEGNPWEGKFQDISKSGKAFWTKISISPIKSMKGEITNILAIVEDITEKMIIESQNAMSQKLESIGRLAAGIAHEINTPMQFIGDNTKFLQDSLQSLHDYIYSCQAGIQDLSSPEIEIIKNRSAELKNKYDVEYLLEEIPRAIEQTQTGINRVTNIIKAMKDFSHPGQKEKIYSNINHGIEVTATISKNEWKYIADLELNLAEDLPLIYCLQDELNQVILSMIINSTHAIEEKIGLNGSSKGKIIIRTYQEKDFAVIKISDTGIGIKEVNIPKLFDPFFTTKPVGKGTGQGLAISHDLIVNKHGGSISVESVYGEGSTFTIKIPVNNHE